MKNLKVADLMSKKVVSFFEEQSLPLAHDLMSLKKMRHIPVVNEEMRVVGIITHRDILRVQSQSLELIEGRATVTMAPNVAVKEVMSQDVWTVNQNASAHDAWKLLIEHAFGCLPVVDDEHRLVGIVTDRDYLRFAITLLEPS